MGEQAKIRKFNISNLTYDDLENMFFHYTWNSNYNSINENGLHASVGPNSRGLDKKQSIFFSKGLEAVLQTWDVWLKWRLNRLNNPLWKGKTFEENLKIQERFHDGLFTSEEYKKYAEWKNEYLSGSYKNDREKLKELYEYQFAELCNSIYFSFNLEEGIDYKTNQIDYKKLNCLQNKNNPNSESYAFFRVMYGDYSDYMSYEVDKWNMQTIPGKDITICPDEIIQLVTGDGKEDVWSILNEFYYIYNSNLFSNKQVKFDLLDDFMKYTRRKQEAYSECDYGNDVKIFRSR